MTTRKRRILFFMSVLFFLLLTPILIEYSRGLRFDFENWQFVETGGFFFKIYAPTESQITIDNKPIKTTSAFSYFNNAFIQNLSPKVYKVKISKDGYQSWEKFLKIDPELVTEAQNVVLMPKDIEAKKYSQDDEKIKKFFYSPDRKYLALVKYNDKNQTILSVIELGSNKETEIFISKDIISLDLYDWQKDDAKIAFYSGDKHSYLIVSVLDGKVQDITTLFSKQFVNKGIDSIKFGPQNNVFLLEDNSLYVLNTASKVLSLLKKDVVSIDTDGEAIYYLLGPDLVFSKAYFDGKTLISDQIMGTIKFKIGKEPDLNISVIDSNQIFVHEKASGLLVEFFGEDNTFRKIDEGVADFALSGDRKKVLYRKNGELWAYYNDDIKIQPYKYAGEKELIARLPKEEVSSVQWFQTDTHLFYSYANSIKFTELDNRDKRNIFHIADFVSPQLFYDSVSKKLYILSKESLYLIDLSNI